MKVSARMGLAYGILLASILLLAATQILAVRRLRALGEEAARSAIEAGRYAPWAREKIESTDRHEHSGRRIGQLDAMPT